MTSTDWTIRPDQRLKYLQIFKTEKDLPASMSGERARVVLTASGLSTQTLAAIWNLADRDTDGELTQEEFLIAYHLVYLATKGINYPAVTPPELIHSASTFIRASLFGLWDLPVCPTPTKPEFFKRYFAALDAAPEVSQYYRWLLISTVFLFAVYCLEWAVICPTALAITNLLAIPHLLNFFFVTRPTNLTWIVTYFAICLLDALVHIVVMIPTIVVTAKGRCTGSVATVFVFEIFMVAPFLAISFFFATRIRTLLSHGDFAWTDPSSWVRVGAPPEAVDGGTMSMHKTKEAQDRYGAAAAGPPL